MTDSQKRSDHWRLLFVSLESLLKVNCNRPTQVAAAMRVNGIGWIRARLARLESTELTGLPGKLGVQTNAAPAYDSARGLPCAVPSVGPQYACHQAQHAAAQPAPGTRHVHR
jgi:hypothetical protein